MEASQAEIALHDVIDKLKIVRIDVADYFSRDPHNDFAVRHNRPRREHCACSHNATPPDLTVIKQNGTDSHQGS